MISATVDRGLGYSPGLMRGAMIGSYRVTDRLAVGGMGEVYVAEHKLIGRKAAIKVLLPHVSQNQRIVERFFQEAKATARLAHPGIVEIFDFGFHDDGRAFLVMEFLHGEPLSERIKRRVKMPLDKLLAITEHVCDALGTAHQNGIVHRDLKPDNIFMVSDSGVRFGERPKLLDFGIAKLKDNENSGLRTGTGVVMGTPAYMSPEQCRGAGGVDERADLYSLGCILFELVCGRRPFTGAAAGELIGLHQFKAPPRPSEVEADVDPGIEAIIVKLLEKKPEDRYQSTGALWRALNALSSSESADGSAGAEFGFADGSDEDSANDATAISSPPYRPDSASPLPSEAERSGLPLPGVASPSQSNELPARPEPSRPPAVRADFIRDETDPVSSGAYDRSSHALGAAGDNDGDNRGDNAGNNDLGDERYPRAETGATAPMSSSSLPVAESVPGAPSLPGVGPADSVPPMALQAQGKGTSGPIPDGSYHTPLTTLQGAAAAVTMPPIDLKPKRRPWIWAAGAIAAVVALIAVFSGGSGQSPTIAASSGGDGVEPAPAPPLTPPSAPDIVKKAPDSKPAATPADKPKTAATKPAPTDEPKRSASPPEKTAKPKKNADKPAPKKAAPKPAKNNAAEYVVLSIDSVPSGARVNIRGHSKSIGTTPLKHRTKRSRKSVILELRKKGYKPASIRVPTSKTAKKKVALKKKPKSGGTKIRTDIF